jgi:Na+/melibiose symporter-like transporter
LSTPRNSREATRHYANGDKTMSLGLILVIVLVIFLLGGFSGRFGGYGYGYGHGGVGLIGTILIIIVILMLLGRLWTERRRSAADPNNQTTLLGDPMTITNSVFRFTQRALWIYIAEAAFVLVIIFLARAFS